MEQYSACRYEIKSKSIKSEAIKQGLLSLFCSFLIQISISRIFVVIAGGILNH